MSLHAKLQDRPFTHVKVPSILRSRIADTGALMRYACRPNHVLQILFLVLYQQDFGVFVWSVGAGGYDNRSPTFVGASVLLV